MKWKSKYTKPQITPNSTRLLRKFAWVPRYIDGNVVWLEYYEVLQGYIPMNYSVHLDGKNVNFIVLEWINLSERLVQQDDRN